MSGDIALDKEIAVGREDSDIIIDYGEISKNHLTIYYDSHEKNFTVVDKSTNGTFIDGIRMEKGWSYTVYPSTTLVLGNDVCRICLDAKYLLK